MIEPSLPLFSSRSVLILPDRFESLLLYFLGIVRQNFFLGGVEAVTVFVFGLVYIALR